MARPSPRRAGAALEPPAEADRAPARSARRLPDRVSQPRQGHQDHPQRGRAEARPDQDLQAHRRAGRRDPQHAAAQPAQARGNGDPQGGQGAARREEVARRAGQLREEAVEDGRRRRSRRCATTFGPKTPLGKRRTDFAEAPEHDEAAIEEAMVVREPITVVVSDKGWIRALRGHVEDLSSVAFKPDDKLKLSFFAETTSKLLLLAHQRPLLHARGREAAGRARPWRAGAAVHRPRAGRRHRHDVPATRAAASSWSRATGQGLRRAPRTNASAPRARASRCSMSKAPDEARAVAPVEGEQVATHRREPQDGDLPARPGAGDGARRAACGCSATRTAACPT